jgi:hypothetical protein
MTTKNVPLLTARDRALFGRLADVLIPDAEGMPSATQVGVHTTWIDEALAARPDLVAPFRRALASDPGHDPAAAISQMHSDDAAVFDAFSVLVSGAYLMCPEVKALIGYPGQEERPVTGDDVPEYIGMLESVVARGPVFRPTITK